MLYLAACLFLVCFPTVYGGASWEYVGNHGPDKWHSSFPNCGGRMQSPINIDTTDVLFDSNLHSFDLRQYAVCRNCSMHLKNVDGHTAEVEYSGTPIIISGGSLPSDYVLDQFHFHWGNNETKSVGSEHLLNNKAAPMEMHIVHHSKQYSKTTSMQKPYGLAVLAFFFKIGRQNNNFNNLLSHFKNITLADQEVELEPFALSDLLPRNSTSYYRYYGSLTTPPCYETVIWTIFTERIEISQEQLDVYRTLKKNVSGEAVSIANDFRPVQELHERRVTSNDKRVLQYMSADILKELRGDIGKLEERCTNDARAVTSSFWVTYCLLVLLLRLTMEMM